MSPIDFRQTLATKLAQLKQVLSPRAATMAAEFQTASEILSRLNPDRTVVVFGGARVKRSDNTWEQARETGYLLGKSGFSVITGGGPGIMEAANMGCSMARNEDSTLGIESVGCNIWLPQEQKLNSSCSLGIEFSDLGPRKLIMIKHSSAVVIFPGGGGTLDELGEIYTLIQTGKLLELKDEKPGYEMPVILVGKAFWSDLLAFLNTKVTDQWGLAAQKNKRILTLVDSPEEAVEIVRNHALEKSEAKLPDLANYAPEFSI